jgi:hypothetical protein
VALLYNVLHATLMIIAIDAYRRWSLPLALVPVGAHLLFGLFVSGGGGLRGVEWGWQLACLRVRGVESARS